MANEQQPKREDSPQSDPERGRVGSTGENRGTAGDESIGASGAVGARENPNKPRPQTHKKSLSLQIEAVRNRKALLQQEMEQLDNQEKQLVETLQAYEDNTSGLNA